MPLSSEQLQRFKEMLDKRREELWAQVSDDLAETENKNLSEQTAAVRDPGDESVALQSSDFNIQMSEKQLAQLREVEAALGRIEEGVYGRCQDCGGEIDVKRLEINPTATRCTHCQARYENMRTSRDMTPSL